MSYETVIGLEIHAQLTTKTKIFCPCSTEFGKAPNENTCPVCLGQPGVLPVLNKKVVEYAMKMGLATHCEIAQKSLFARKNYFYPDLPKGYQISQYEAPIAERGWVEIANGEGKKKIGITRIHMEEDAGKLLHEHPETRETNATWVDLNRAGIPLIEIVSEPDLRSPEEASNYLKMIRNILLYLEICDGNMEEGSLRCDANISLRPQGQKEFGTKAELKNMNSFKNVEKALKYEIERQTDLLENGGRVMQETRLWDDAKGITHPMRSKEEAHDYRYFPDPDLLPVIITQDWIDSIQKNLPELAGTKKERFMKDYKLPEYDASLLTQSKSLAVFFEACTKLYQDSKKISNWIMTELLRELKNDNKEIEDSKITPELLTELLQMIDSGVITNKIGKVVFTETYKTGERPTNIVKERGLEPMNDQGALTKAIDQTIAANPKEVERYRGGDEKLLSFFIGQVMKETKGKAHPETLREALLKKLKS